MSEQQQRQPHPMDTARAQIDARIGEFSRALPPGISGEIFARAAITALQVRPELALADRRSLFVALMKAAEDGLLPDGREGALNVYKTKIKQKFRRADGSEGEREDWIQSVQWLPMVEGVRKLLWNSGIILETGVVYKHDDWHYQRGDDPRIKHTPRPGPRSKANMVAVYSIARFPDGRIHRDWLWTEEVEQLRTTYSKAANFGAWGNDASYPEMAIKSVVHHHSKSLPVSSEFRAMVNRPEFWDSHPEQTPTVLTERPAAPAIAHQPTVPMDPVQERPTRTVEGVMGALADGEQVEAPARQRRQRQARNGNGAGGSNGVPAPQGGVPGVAGATAAQHQPQPQAQQHEAPPLQPDQQAQPMQHALQQQRVVTDTDGTHYDGDTGVVIEDHEAQEAQEWRESENATNSLDAAQQQADTLEIPSTLRRLSVKDELQALADSPQPDRKEEYVPWFESRLEFATTPEKKEALRQWWSLTGGMRQKWGIVPADFKGLKEKFLKEDSNA